MAARPTVPLGRLRFRPRLPEWIVWHFIALIGVVLALGGNTPLGPLLVHLPLFGDQRLQSRNVLVPDLALAVLLAYWADNPLTERSQRFVRAHFSRRVDRETVLGVLPPLAAIAVVVLGLVWGAGLLRWLGVSPSAATVAGRLRPWLVPYALTGAGAIAFVIFGRHLPPRLRSRWLGGFVAVDLVVFTLLAVIAVLPGLGRDANAAASGGAPRPIAAPGHREPASAISPRSTRPPGTSAPRWRCQGSRCRTRTPGRTRPPGLRLASWRRVARRAGSPRARKVLRGSRSASVIR